MNELKCFPSYKCKQMDAVMKLYGKNSAEIISIHKMNKAVILGWQKYNGGFSIIQLGRRFRH